MVSSESLLLLHVNYFHILFISGVFIVFQARFFWFGISCVGFILYEEYSYLRYFKPLRLTASVTSVEYMPNIQKPICLYV